MGGGGGGGGSLEKDCVNKAPPSCGLPEELGEAVMKSVFEGESRTVEEECVGERDAV